jgi:hypothetical protein
MDIDNCSTCYRFAGIKAPNGKIISRLEFSLDGGSEWGIDDLRFGIFNCPTITPPTGTNHAICAGETIPASTVTVAGLPVDWFSAASGGAALANGTLSYTPTAAGTFYAEARNTTTGCRSATRTAVTLTVNPLPTLTADTPACAANLQTYSFTFTSNGTVTASAGTISGRTVSGVPVGTNVTLTATSTPGCVATLVVNAPDCDKPVGSIGDYVWKDANKNGIQDTNEEGVNGVKVILWNADPSGTPTSKRDSTTTAGGGKYLFNNLPKGDPVFDLITSVLTVGFSTDSEAIIATNEFTNITDPKKLAASAVRLSCRGCSFSISIWQ